MEEIRTLIVEDNLEFLEAVHRFLDTDSQVTVVGTVSWGEEAAAAVAKLNPDLVLMDLALPDVSGFEAMRQIKVQPVSPKVVVLTLHDTPTYRAVAESVGADGFISKADVYEGLLPVIHSLFAKR